jgi:pyrimidine operon attenuation protein/uracil phosphoribosyltransferase
METRETVKAQLMDARDLDRTLDRMARQIAENLDPAADGGAMALIGMQSRGVHIARRLRSKIEAVEGVKLPLGVLDTTLYRDDYRIRSSHPEVRVTDIPFDVSSRHVVLVDDVLYTGRTVRAALDALLDLGRPASVQFLVLIDRGHREFPVCADLIGRTVPTTPGEAIRVKLVEQDSEDGVWLIETKVEQQERNRQPSGKSED